MNGLPLNVPCRLIVRSRAGATEITGVWDAWRTGPVTVPASAGWLPSDIASLQVATTTRNLVTITGRPGERRRITARDSRVRTLHRADSGQSGSH